MSILNIVLLNILIMVVSFIVTLLAFMWVMPKKAKMDASKWYQFLPRKVVGFVGYLVDIVWSTTYGTIIHLCLSRNSIVSPWPPHVKKGEKWRLYKFTLTERMQMILDNDPIDSMTYILSDKMRVILNKYDNGHLTLRALI